VLERLESIGQRHEGAAAPADHAAQQRSDEGARECAGEGAGRHRRQGARGEVGADRQHVVPEDFKARVGGRAAERALQQGEHRVQVLHARPRDHHGRDQRLRTSAEQRWACRGRAEGPAPGVEPEAWVSGSESRRGDGDAPR